MLPVLGRFGIRWVETRAGVFFLIFTRGLLLLLYDLRLEYGSTERLIPFAEKITMSNGQITKMSRSRKKTEEHSQTLIWSSLVILYICISVVRWFSNFSVLQNHLEGLLNRRLLIPRFSEFLIQQVLDEASWICISNKFPGDNDAAGLGTISGKPLLWSIGDKSQIAIAGWVDYERVEAGYVNYSFRRINCEEE